MHAIIIGAIVLSVALGYTKKINIGYLAIGFAYLIGAFLLNIPPGKIIGMWPTNFFFLLLSICLFYGFAIANGTLDAISLRFVYASRKKPYLVPFALFLVCFIIAAIGPGAPAVFVFMPAFIMSVAKETRMKPLLGTIIIATGANAGAWSSIAVNGIITKQLIELAGYGSQAAAHYSNVVWLDVACSHLALFVAAYFVTRGYKIGAMAMKRPSPLTREQKINLCLIAAALACVIVPAVLHAVIPANAMIAKVAGKADITLISIIGTVLALLFKIGDEKKAMSYVPWTTIILICGVGVLIAIAVQAGTVKLLGASIGSNVSGSVLPFAMGIVAFAMCYFSSLLGVVLPTLYPLVPALVANIPGAHPAILFSIIAIGAAASGCSPFSTAGALSITGLREELDRHKLFTELLYAPALFLIFFLCGLGVRLAI